VLRLSSRVLLVISTLAQDAYVLVRSRELDHEEVNKERSIMGRSFFIVPNVYLKNAFYNRAEK
jgi:hypothetical protein